MLKDVVMSTTKPQQKCRLLHSWWLCVRFLSPTFVSTTPGRAGKPTGICHFQIFLVKFHTHKLDLVVKWPRPGRINKSCFFFTLAYKSKCPFIQAICVGDFLFLEYVMEGCSFTRKHEVARQSYFVCESFQSYKHRGENRRPKSPVRLALRGSLTNIWFNTSYPETFQLVICALQQDWES